ncbi:transporter [Nisaea sp.]|uniref:transporter n=1 Tax=Nisaea sp. TaxID=2024842 RepID=UPI003298EC14
MSFVKQIVLKLYCVVVALAFSSSAVIAEDSSSTLLAKQLSNPVANLISVPIQFNYDRGIGPNDDGYRLTANIQPVIPFKLSSEWTLITRTILPVVYQDDIFPSAGSQFGLGDTVQSFFFSPKPISIGGGSAFTWGAGPAMLYRTGTDKLLSSGKWGAGPTFVGLMQSGGWTYGALANHLWSFAGDNKRSDVSTTFLQPFASYTTSDAWTFSLTQDVTYEWETDESSLPINANVSKLTTIGTQPVSIGVGTRYYLRSATGGPEGWGARLTMTFLFPTQ